MIDGCIDERAGRLLGRDVVLIRARDGSARLLGLDGAFSALSPTAAQMLILAATCGQELASLALADEYGEPRDRLRADLRDFLDDLRRRGYLRPSRPVRRGLLGRLLEVGLAGLVGPLLRSRPTRGRAFVLLGLASLGFRAVGWSRTVAAWGLAAGDRAGGGDQVGVRDAVDAAVVEAAAVHPAPVACKERGLVAWAWLRRAGVPARLVLGVDLYPFRCHCWCEAGGHIVADHADRCASYTEFRSHE